MKSHIKVALFLVCITLLLFCWGLFQNGKAFYALSRGNYFFENSRDNLQLSSITLDFENNQQITIVQTDGFWRIKEADDYFASFSQTSSLLKFISETVIYRADKLNENDIRGYFENSIKIVCKDNKGNILDYAVIALKNDKNRYHYALLNDTPFLFQLKGNFNPSSVLMDWVQMPLLQFYEDDIKRIETDDFAIYRRFSDEPLKSVENDEPAFHIGKLINNLRYLNAEEIKHITHFSPASFQKTKHYDITFFDGMIYRIELYEKDNEYWLRILLKNEIIASLDVVKTVKEKQILYDGWFFKINKDKGHIISNFTL